MLWPDSPGGDASQLHQAEAHLPRLLLENFFFWFRETKIKMTKRERRTEWAEKKVSYLKGQMFPEINYLCQTETGAVIWAGYSSGEGLPLFCPSLSLKPSGNSCGRWEDEGCSAALSTRSIHRLQYSCNSSLHTFWIVKKKMNWVCMKAL